MNCLHCQKPVKKRNKFCNSSCSACFNNKERSKNGYSLKNKFKETKCLDCNNFISVGVNSSIDIRCKNCSYKKILKDNNVLINVTCNDCFCIFMGTKYRLYCDFCSKKRIVQGARNSVLSQKENRRSKNEIYFSELCEIYFGLTNIKTNQPIFNGWDADIIIENLKIAILWNGKWHYEKIKKDHSVIQVQNRDRIKVKSIIKCGYIPYVIKDLGAFNKEFVDLEFNKFTSVMGV